MSLLDEIRDQLPGDAFDEGELKLVLRGHSPASLHSLLSRLLKDGKINKLRRGLYVFGERYQKRPLSNYVIAAKLYSPSYISFESALSYHGLIPEAVYVTTSACAQLKKKYYPTPLGDYSYQYIPPNSFRLGVESLSTPGGTFLMANPIKALFDLIYIRKKTYPDVSAIQGDLRIEAEELLAALKNYSSAEVEALAKSYGRKGSEQLFRVLKREFL